MNKKGVSHIEVIFSFLIFIGFFAVIFIYLNPFAKTVSQSDISDIDNGIKQLAQEQLLTTSFVLNSTTAVTGCFSISLDNPGEVIVKDASGSIIASKKEASTIKINSMKTAGATKIYYVYSSGEFASGSFSGDCALLKEGVEYSLGGLEKTQVISYNTLLSLHNSYTSNYADFKSRINTNQDFVFMVYDLQQNRINELSGVKSIPKINVITKSSPIGVLNQSGDIKTYNLIIQAW